MQSANNLRVRAHARSLTVELYRVTASVPASERYGRTAHLRRAAVSIGSNITVRLERMLATLIKALRKSLHEKPTRP